MLQLSICNRFNNVLMTSVDIKRIALLNIHGLDYRCIINKIGKIEAISILKNADLTEKIGALT